MGYQGGNVSVIQIPGKITMAMEYQHMFRVIHMDNRALLADDVKLWAGFSRGRWEGDTLVVEVTNLNDKTWLDLVGSFHSDEMRVTERYRVLDANTMEYRATVDDLKVFTRPWTIGYTMLKDKESVYEEYEDACFEGNTKTVPLQMKR